MKPQPSLSAPAGPRGRGATLRRRMSSLLDLERFRDAVRARLANPWAASEAAGAPIEVEAPEVLPPAAAPEPEPGLDPATLALVIELGRFGEFSEIMQRHLANVCRETETASADIMRLAIRIEGGIHALVTFIASTMTSEEFVRAGGETEARVRDGRAVLDALRRQREESARDIQEQLDAACALSGRMQGFLADVERIRMQTDLLAVNANIKIARAGGTATGLDVIASEIRKLADHTGVLAQRLQESVGGMQHMISVSLADRIAAQVEQDQAAAEKLSVSYDALSSNMSFLIDLQQSMLVKVHEDSAALAAPMMELSGSIQFQDVARQQLEQVGAAIGGAAEHIVALSVSVADGGPAPASSIGQCLDSASASYVMAQQRQAHGSAAGGAAQAIELF